MIITPNMGLNVWNQTTDLYSSEEQAENFVRIDLHDHTEGKGRPITTGALEDGAVTAAKLDPVAVSSLGIADGSIAAIKLAANAVTTAKVANQAITNAKLESPISGVHRKLISYSTIHNSGLASGTYFLGPNGTATTIPVSSGATSAPTLRLDSSLFTVNALTPKLRIYAQVGLGSSAPSSDFAFSLRPLTFSGGSISLGSAVTNSTVTISNPAATNAFTSSATADFNIPTTGQYAVTVTTSASTVAASFLNAQLYVRAV